MKMPPLTPGNWPWFKATPAQWRYALRNTIAMCLALTFAYYLNLDEPYWAMTSAAVVSFPTVGGVISKSLGRVAGSLLGATAALIIAGHTLNEPWLFLLSMSVWIGFCTWACAHFTNNVAYAFQLAGYTAHHHIGGDHRVSHGQYRRDHAVMGYRAGPRMRGHCRYLVRGYDDDDPTQHLRWHHVAYSTEKHAYAFAGTCQFALATGDNGCHPHGT